MSLKINIGITFKSTWHALTIRMFRLMLRLDGLALTQAGMDLSSLKDAAMSLPILE